MACRIKNLGKHPLHLDLKGGEVLLIPPGALSRPLREELLYTNPYLPLWIRDGLAARLEIPFADVLAMEERERALVAAGLSREAAEAALEEVDGLGPALARQLVDSGMVTVRAVATSPPAALAELPGIGKVTADRIIADARKRSGLRPRPAKKAAKKSAKKGGKAAAAKKASQGKKAGRSASRKTLTDAKTTTRSKSK